MGFRGTGRLLLDTSVFPQRSLRLRRLLQYGEEGSLFTVFFMAFLHFLVLLLSPLPL